MGDSTFYVTTPIYYVNDKPHIGHAYTTILADVIAQYNRMLKKDTFFLTGTDEHGQKVDEAARALDRKPLEHCNITVTRFLELWEKLQITNDGFIKEAMKDGIVCRAKDSLQKRIFWTETVLNVTGKLKR